MTTFTIDAKSSLTTPDILDVLPILDVSANVLKKVTAQDLINSQVDNITNAVTVTASNVGSLFNAAGTNIEGATTNTFFGASGTFGDGATVRGIGYQASLGTQAASFTLGTMAGFRAVQGTIGAASTVTNNHGFLADSTLVGGTNNYGFKSDIAAAANRWNFYAAGTALNYMQGALYANGGVSFDSGTNILDEYEMGTWTPAWQAATGSPSITYTIQEGLYCRIGDMVYLWGRLGTSAFTAAGAAAIRISGQPFSCVNTSGLSFAGNIGYANDFVANEAPSGLIAVENQSYLLLYRKASSDANSELSQSLVETNMGTGTSDNEIIFSVCYRVA